MNEYINLKHDNKNKKYKCLKCNKDFFTKHLLSQYILWPRHRYSSKAEEEIKKWILSVKNDLDIVVNKRFYGRGKSYHELDLYLPDLNLGIEHYGLYWHSDIHKDKNYHKEKYKFFEERGINVIQVFENERLNKQDVVKSIILNKLGLSENKYYGRELQIKELDNSTYKLFCEKNHIQGYGIAKIRLGLYTKNDELVEIMSFSNSRYNKKYDWENIRTCTKLNCTVMVGFSKLLKYFNSNHSGSIISYVDVRYFNGNGYLKNGFEIISHSPPNYFYFKRKEMFLHPRVKFQKHKLKNILNNFDDSLTEYENMLKNKYFRIFDAGNLVFILR